MPIEPNSYNESTVIIDKHVFINIINNCLSQELLNSVHTDITINYSCNGVVKSDSYTNATFQLYEDVTQFVVDLIKTLTFIQETFQSLY